jgi:hypothetical protein
MTSEGNDNPRKTIRDFKGRIELMRKTELKKLESLFLEIYDLSLQYYIQKEKEKYPNKTHKEIIIDMYKFHDRLRGRKKKDG